MSKTLDMLSQELQETFVELNRLRRENACMSAELRAYEVSRIEVIGVENHQKHALKLSHAQLFDGRWRLSVHLPKQETDTDKLNQQLAVMTAERDGWKRLYEKLEEGRKTLKMALNDVLGWTR